MIICFDVDGTLLDYNHQPRQDVINLIHKFHAHGVDVAIWSGGGVDYAKHKAEQLGLSMIPVIAKGSITPDIAVDDMDVSLGLFNLKV